MSEVQDDGILMSKLISGLTLFIVSVLFGIVPFKLAKVFKWSEPIDPSSKSNKKSSRVVSSLLCFGGGVLLATTFLHLLPDINEEILILQRADKIPLLNIALGETLMLCGFFLIYLIEEIVHYYLHRYQEKLKKSHKNQTKEKLEDETFGEAFMRGISTRNSVHRRFSESNGAIPITDGNNDTKTLSVIVEKESKSTEKESHVNDMNHNHSHGGHGHSHTALPIPHSDDEDMLVSSLRGLLIVLALSIHELFEGFAVGLQKTSYGVYYMFAAVCAHKFVISFCIGVELMVQRTKLWLAFIYIFVYSVVSALGILVGAVLTSGSLGDTLQVPNVILQGLATGTLLYVIFFEVLSKDRSGMIPYVSILFGFLIMTGLQYIADVTENRGTTIFQSTTPSYVPEWIRL